MNDKQKTLLIIAVISFFIFISTAYLFYNNGYSIFSAYRGGGNNPTFHTNWLGIFSIGIFFGSLLGAYLFKDK